MASRIITIFQVRVSLKGSYINIDGAHYAAPLVLTLRVQLVKIPEVALGTSCLYLPIWPLDV